MDRQRSFSFLCGLAAALVLASCSSGPAPPAMGTPPFYWQAAKETFAAGDYLKTNDHLEQLSKGENEFTARAQPWRMVLTSGMAKGYMDLADSYEFGSRANKTNPTPFRKQTSEYRTRASQAALAFAETFERFEKSNKDATITLAFAFPTGSAGQPPQLKRVGEGILIQPAEAEDAQAKMLQRGVLLATCQAVGAPGDVAKAQELFKSGEVKVPRDTFILAMASTLYDQALLFGPTKIDQPQRMKFFCEHALEAAKSVPESKERKELVSKVQATLKKTK